MTSHYLNQITFFYLYFYRKKSKNKRRKKWETIKQITITVKPICKEFIPTYIRITYIEYNIVYISFMGINLKKKRKEKRKAVLYFLSLLFWARPQLKSCNLPCFMLFNIIIENILFFVCSNKRWKKTYIHCWRL